MKAQTIPQNSVQCSESPSNGNGNNYAINHINKDEKNYHRLLIEQRELKKKKDHIDNRLVEIQKDLNIRREEIRNGGLVGKNNGQ